MLGLKVNCITKENFIGFFFLGILLRISLGNFYIILTIMKLETYSHYYYFPCLVYTKEFSQGKLCHCSVRTSLIGYVAYFPCVGYCLLVWCMLSFFFSFFLFFSFIEVILTSKIVRYLNSTSLAKCIFTVLILSCRSCISKLQLRFDYVLCFEGHIPASQSL